MCRESAFFLVIDHFNNEESNILSELRSHPRSLFLYLKTFIEAYFSGTLNFNLVTEDNIISTKDKSDGLEAYLDKIANFPKFLSNNPIHITDDMIELYLEVSTWTTNVKYTDFDWMVLFPFQISHIVCDPPVQVIYFSIVTYDISPLSSLSA